jgi:glycosyltransferase involved in cell wall biosynthesis
MKILLLHQYFLEDDDPGGSRWNEMTRTWSAMGHDITVLGGMVHYNGHQKRKEYQGRWVKEKKQGEVTVWRCHVSESYNKSYLGRLWGYFSFMFSSMYCGLFKVKGQFDIIVVTSPPLFIGITGFVLAKAKRLPLVFEVRDLWPESAIDTGMLTSKLLIKMAFATEQFIYRQSKLINVLTPAFLATLRDKKNVPQEKLIFIPNAADFTLSEHLLQSFDTQAFRQVHDLEGRFVITYVGAHGLANHLEQVLHAGKLLEDTNVLFLLIGDGNDKSRLLKQAEAMGSTNVRFIDPVPKAEVFKYILASEMGASILKKVDTFKTVYSNKTFDYMACKKPILMAIDGISRTLLEQAGAGSYVEPENAQEYNTIIRKYLNDPDRLKREGESGYLFARNKFDRQLLANEYIGHLSKLTGKK